MRSQSSERLQAGALAPNFEAETWDGTPVRLQSLRGKRVWLAFFRHVNCPFCNIRLYAMRDVKDALAGRVEVVAIFQSPRHKFQDSPAQARAWFPMISDPEERLYALYRLEAGWDAMLNLKVGKALVSGLGKGLLPKPADGTFTRVPADFLIHADGTLAQAYYGADVADHIPLEDVRRFAH